MTEIPKLRWSTPSRSMTARGERIVRTAVPTEAFWKVWRENKPALQAAGYSVTKYGEVWAVKHYEPLPEEELKAKAATRETSRATDADVEIVVPAGLAYLPYQRAGITFAMGRPATLIADEMGLGKTIQAIGVINTSPDAKRVLVICPASLRLNWARELKKWMVRDLPIAVIESGKTKFIPRTAEVLVINYDLLKKFRKELRAKPWDIVIADECHALKNGKAQRTQEVVGRKARGDEEAI